MTIAYSKNWIAKDIINMIIGEVIDNPIFGYSFFAHIIKYIQKYEMKQNNDNNKDIDLSILKQLGPERFLICDLMIQLQLFQKYTYMNKRYKMPESFSQIKYTDFRIHLVAMIHQF